MNFVHQIVSGCRVMILAALPLVAGSGQTLAQVDRDLGAYLDQARQQIESTTLSLADRAQVALEAASVLDQAARNASRMDQRRSTWSHAVALLDDFVTNNPNFSMAPAFELRSAIYQWAIARTWLDMLDSDPDHEEARTEARTHLKEAISRLELLVTGSPRDRNAAEEDAFAQNVRYRLALALADRADLLETEVPGEAAGDRQRALLSLEPIPSEPSLSGHAELLRARLLLALNRLEAAETALEAAELANPAPDPNGLIDARVNLLERHREFEKALRAIEAAEISPPRQDLLAVRLRLKQWLNLFPGEQRNAVESDIYERIGRLRDEGHPEARPALLALNETFSRPNALRLDPKAWQLLSEASLMRGDFEHAIALMLEGADRIQSTQGPDQPWIMRFRAGAIAYQAEDYVRADSILSDLLQHADLANNPSIVTLLPKASLLHALALGQLAASTGAGARASTAYEQALVDHLDWFPEDPTSGEMRWALAAIRHDSGDLDEAVALWSAIPLNDPRRLEARLLAAESLQVILKAKLEEGDTREARQTLVKVRETFNTFRAETEKPSERLEIDLARVRLELTPGLGDPAQALEVCEQVQRTSVSADQRDQARRLRILALALLGRYPDAERSAREEVQQAAPTDLLKLAARLDEASESIESISAKRRLGYLIRLLAEGALEEPERLTQSERLEALIRQTRGLMAIGDLDNARRFLARQNIDPQGLESELLNQLAAAQSELGFHELAVEGYRQLTKRLSTGSRPWLDARYGLALSQYRAGETDQARRLLEATATLYPDLGGGELKEKYLRFRRRIEQR